MFGNHGSGSRIPARKDARSAAIGRRARVNPRTTFPLSLEPPDGPFRLVLVSLQLPAFIERLKILFIAAQIPLDFRFPIVDTVFTGGCDDGIQRVGTAFGTGRSSRRGMARTPA